MIKTPINLYTDSNFFPNEKKEERKNLKTSHGALIPTKEYLINVLNHDLKSK